MTALSDASPLPFTTELGMATIALRTRRFGDCGPAVMLTMPGMCLASSVFVIVVTSSPLLLSRDSGLENYGSAHLAHDGS